MKKFVWLIFCLIFISFNKVEADDIYEDIVETALKNNDYIIEVKHRDVDNDELLNDTAIKNRISNFVQILLKKGFVIEEDEFRKQEIKKNRNNYYHDFYLVKDSVYCRVALKFEFTKMPYRYNITEKLFTHKIFEN